MRSSGRWRSNRSDDLWSGLTGQSAISLVRTEVQWTSADRKWTVHDRAAQLVRRGGQLHDGAERPAALELRRPQRATDQPVVGLLRDARHRPRQLERLAADSDGAELHRGSGQRPDARQKHRSVHALDVHQPLTSSDDASAQPG